MSSKQFWNKWIFNINKASFLLIVIPYLGFNWQELYNSPFFSFNSFFILISILILIEIGVKILLNKLIKKEWYISIFVSSFFIIFFYGNYPVDPIFNLFNKNWGIIIRGKSIVIFILIGIILFQYYWIIQRNKTYKFFNIFLIIFSIITFISGHNPNKNIENNVITSRKIDLSSSHIKSEIKPIILIIADEYNSPYNLYTLFNDSSLFDFSKQLIKSNWIVNNNSYSNETSTIHSIASIFNYNLSLDTNYKKRSMEYIWYHFLKKSTLIEELYQKKVQFINYGIFDLNDKRAFSHLYIYPKNFTEQFLLYSCYLFAKRSSINFNGKKLSGKNEIIMEHNKYFVYNSSELLKNIKTNSFAYIHLFMPHAPLQFEPEFKRKELKNICDYKEYWNFSNRKILSLLKGLTKSNQYRIILTGDHGLRGMPTDPHSTFTAYYGFDSLSVSKIKSVQDLGILINESF
jgi:hypothetical protein